MTEISKPNYLAQARKLSEDEAERVLSRMTGKLPRRLHKDKLSRDEALAVQLEIEDEKLQEWREAVHHMREKEAAKAAKAAKKEAGENKAASRKKADGAKAAASAKKPAPAKSPAPRKKLDGKAAKKS